MTGAVVSGSGDDAAKCASIFDEVGGAVASGVGGGSGGAECVAAAGIDVAAAAPGSGVGGGSDWRYDWRYAGTVASPPAVRRAEEPRPVLPSAMRAAVGSVPVELPVSAGLGASPRARVSRAACVRRRLSAHDSAAGGPAATVGAGAIAAGAGAGADTGAGGGADVAGAGAGASAGVSDVDFPMNGE